MNTQTQEALKMAIEFMGTLTIDVGIKTWNEKHRKEAIKACKEALEQPAPSWQGLSLPDIEALYKQSDSISLYAFTQDVRAIEQALKNKNANNA